MKKVNIGLDIGIASVGWAVVDCETKKIIKAGSRLFEEANSGNNGPITSDRRAQRGRRRNLRRKITRKQDLLSLFIKYNMIENEQSFYELNFDFDQLDIRKKALLEKITKEQILIILFNYMKHRGSFNYKDDVKELEQVSEEELEFKSELRLPVDIQLNLREQYQKFRGINKADSLIAHDWYLKELEIILDTQIKEGVINNYFKDEYLVLYNRKREYYEGPGPKNREQYNPSVYGWKDQEEFFDRLAGKDTYDSNEMRAPKHSLTSYLFNILNDLNNLSINGRRDFITYKNKRDLIKLTLENKNKTAVNIKLKQIAKILDVEKEKITGFRIKASSKEKDKEEDFTEFKSINKIRAMCIKNEKSIDFISLENIDKLDSIIEVLTKYQSTEHRAKELKKLNYDFLDDQLCESLGLISLNGTHALSKKTMNKFIEHMWHENKNHMELLNDLKMKPDYKFKVDVEKLKTIPILRKKISEMYISPVVKRALIESLKIIKEIEKFYENQFEINDIVIELAREKNSEDQKQNIKKGNQKNVDNIQRIKDDLGIDISEMKVKQKQKFIFYKEQDGKCAYSNKKIDIERLKTDPNYCEIDHIIPWSISFDDSQANKVLVLREENQNKGQQTPYQYFRKIGGDWETFRLWAIDTYLSKKLGKYGYSKFNNLLIEIDFSDIKEQMKFISRNLNDTRYATVEVKNYLEYFKKELEKKWKIKTINGRFTSFLRSSVLHLPKKERADFSHHAKDAVVIALSPLIKINSKETVETLLDNVQKELFVLEKNEINEINPSENNVDTIRKDIENFKYLFTKKNLKKINTQLFDETLYSTKLIDEKLHKIMKIDIFNNGNDEKITKLFTAEQKDLLIKESDPKTFNFLQDIFNNYYGKSYKDEKGKEHKVKNPFRYFRDIEKGVIVKQSKEHKPPLIKSLRYIGDEIGNYYDISHKFKNIKNNKKVVHTSLNKIGWDIYYNEKLDKYKVLELNINAVNFNQEVDRNSNKYKEQLNKIDINKDYVFKFNLDKYDEVTFSYDGKKMNYIIVGSANRGTILEFKELKTVTKSRIRISISKIKQLKKVTSNVTRTKIKILE